MDGGKHAPPQGTGYEKHITDVEIRARKNDDLILSFGKKNPEGFSGAVIFYFRLPLRREMAIEKDGKRTTMIMKDGELKKDVRYPDVDISNDGKRYFFINTRSPYHYITMVSDTRITLGSLRPDQQIGYVDVSAIPGFFDYFMMGLRQYAKLKEGFAFSTSCSCDFYLYNRIVQKPIDLPQLMIW